MFFYHKGLRGRKTSLPFVACDRKAAILRVQIWSAHESDVVGLIGYFLQPLLLGCTLGFLRPQYAGVCKNTGLDHNIGHLLLFSSPVRCTGNGYGTPSITDPLLLKPLMAALPC